MSIVCWVGLRAKWLAAGSRRGVARNRREHRPASGLSRLGVIRSSSREGVVFTIGIDPHKTVHAAAVLDDTGTVIDELRLVADRHQRDRLLQFADRYAPRTWAIEGATGLGANFGTSCSPRRFHDWQLRS